MGGMIRHVMASEVRLQLLLRPEWRSTEGVERVKDTLRSLGVEVTGSGRVTVSARADARPFRGGVGRLPTRQTGQPTEETAIEVPLALRELVELVTIAPRHLLMDHSSEEGDAP